VGAGGAETAALLGGARRGTRGARTKGEKRSLRNTQPPHRPVTPVASTRDNLANSRLVGLHFVSFDHAAPRAQALALYQGIREQV